MSKSTSHASNIKVVPVEWLDATAFAEVGKTSRNGSTRVYLSKELDPSSRTVRNRISRLVGHLSNEDYIGEDECELAVA